MCLKKQKTHLGPHTHILPFPSMLKGFHDLTKDTHLTWMRIFRHLLKCKRSTPETQCFQSGLVGKESTCDTGDTGSIPGSGRSPGGGNGNPLQYSRLENPTDRGAWWASVHGVAKSRTQLKRLSMHACQKLKVLRKQTRLWVKSKNKTQKTTCI